MPGETVVTTGWLRTWVPAIVGGSAMLATVLASHFSLEARAVAALDKALAAQTCCDQATTKNEALDSRLSRIEGKLDVLLSRAGVVAEISR